MLEDTHIKLASVVSDGFGTSGRRRLAVVGGGARNPAQLSALALGTWRRQSPQLEVVLEGQLTAHHARLIAGALELVDMLGRQMAEMDRQLQKLLSEAAPQLEQLDSMPGVKAMTARDLIAEIGLDMPCFGSAFAPTEIGDVRTVAHMFAPQDESYLIEQLWF